MTDLLRARLRRVRVSTALLVVVLALLIWVDQTVSPAVEAARAPTAAVVPPGFVPDPDYTWVPRSAVAPSTTRARPRPTDTSTTATTTPTSTPETPTTPATPGQTPPTGASAGQPVTTIVDPDGSGPLPAQTVISTPAATSSGVPGPSASPSVSTTAGATSTSGDGPVPSLPLQPPR